MQESGKIAVGKPLRMSIKELCLDLQVDRNALLPVVRAIEKSFKKLRIPLEIKVAQSRSHVELRIQNP
mgnify:CR=1 FL=1